jgi:hypothetical protein
MKGQSMTEPLDAGMIEMTSGVSAFTGNPFVVVQWGAKTGQLTPAETREMALHFLSCADAAESDAAVMKQLRDADLSEAAAALFVLGIRERREKGTQ